MIGERGVLALDAFAQNIQYFDDRAGRYALVPFTEGGDPQLVRSFIEAIRRDTVPLVTGEDGLRALEVALCAYASAQCHEVVACPQGVPM